MDRSHKTTLVLSGTYIHASGTTEQTLLEIPAAQWGGGAARLRMVIDCEALTRTTTFRARVAVDGTNFRTLRGPHSLAAADEADQYDEIAVSGVPVRYTLQSSTNEGASRSIPYQLTIET